MWSYGNQVMVVFRLVFVCFLNHKTSNIDAKNIFHTKKSYLEAHRSNFFKNIRSLESLINLNSRKYLDLHAEDHAYSGSLETSC